jgi:hypothetical protein
MICGAEACKLSAMIHGAELRVHFLKYFQKRSTCENLSQKGLKRKKKDGARDDCATKLCVTFTVPIGVNFSLIKPNQLKG